MYNEEEPCEQFIDENQKLKDEIFELKKRLKWIEDLAKGILDYGLIVEVIKRKI